MLFSLIISPPTTFLSFYAKQICVSRRTLSGQPVHSVSVPKLYKIPTLASVKFAMVCRCTMGVFISEFAFFFKC